MPRPNGHVIEHLRVARGITRQELADRIGRSRKTLYNIERYSNSTSREVIARIARCLHVAPSDLTDPVVVRRGDVTREVAA